MFCSRCGQAVSTQPYCPNCGAPTGIAAPTVGVPAAAAYPFPAAFPDARVARHLRTLGILWVVFACYLALQWALLLPFLHFAFAGRTPWMAGSNQWMYAFHPGGWLLHIITLAIAIRVILSLATGIALLTRQPWGRVFAIVIAFLTLLKPFLGTLLAIYTLWVLLSRNAGQEYESIALSDGGVPVMPGTPGART